MGYLLAFVSSIFFSLYVIPRKLSSDISPLLFSLLTGTGFFISSVVLFLFKPLLGFEEVLNIQLLWSVLAGIIWAVGFVLFVKSIDIVGLARSNQWKNLQGPIGVILSLIILSEYATINPLFAVLAGIAIFLSANAFNVASSKEEAKSNLSGIYLATASGLAFGIVTVINKHVTTEVGVYLQQIVWSASITLSILIYLAIQKNMLSKIKTLDKKNVFLGLIAGLLYLGASFFMLQSYNYLPASIAFTIIQLSAVWTVAVGIFFFKEIDSKLFYKRILLGFILTIVGIALLVLAKI